MKITCVIPAHNFSDGVVFLARWLEGTLEDFCEDYEILVYDDQSTEYHRKQIESVTRLKHTQLISVEKMDRRNLKITYSKAAHHAIASGHGAVLIAESDAVPSFKSLASMFEVFTEPSCTPLASVSPIYRWGGAACYPTHPHWFTDGKFNGSWTYSGAGEVALVGNAGIPFVFSMWNPEALKLIHDPSLPPFWKLDTEFGKVVHAAGFHQLRLVNVNVGHYAGGRASRRGIDGFSLPEPIGDICLFDSAGNLEVLPTVSRGLRVFARHNLASGKNLGVLGGDSVMRFAENAKNGNVIVGKSGIPTSIQPIQSGERIVLKVLEL